MSKAVYSAYNLLLLIFLTSCSLKKEDLPSLEKIFVLAEHESSSAITALRTMIEPRINAIMQEEISSLNPEDAPLFKIPTHQNLTLYYMFDYQIQEVDRALQTLNALSRDMKKSCVVNLQKPAFFGIKNDELVIQLNDTDSCLIALHYAVQKVLQRAHTNYMQEQGKSLYDLTKSEHFEFVPHITLGRLPTNDARFTASKVDTIKERIKKEVFPEIFNFIAKNPHTIQVTGIEVYNISTNTHVQHYLFEN